MGLKKIGLKAAKHSAWLLLSLWTGFTFVGFFTPIRELWSEALAFAGWNVGGPTPTLGPWEAFWVGFYGFATYGNAGWMREQVCKYMCPYARFQSAMFDRDTMIITYDRARGEPRGGRSRKDDYRQKGLGDCVDCGICVQVCPTGIDIRDGLQYECIGCAACIDGCNQVMDRMGYARGLIRYSTTSALERGLTRRQMLARAFRPRVLVYSAALLAIVVAAGVSLSLRVPLKVDVIRDRAAIAREVGDGEIENVYRLQIMNTTEQARMYEVRVEGLKEIHIAGNPALEVPGATSRMVPVRIRVHVEREHAGPGTYPIRFTVRALEAPQEVVHEKSVFIVR